MFGSKKSIKSRRGESSLVNGDDAIVWMWNGRKVRIKIRQMLKLFTFSTYSKESNRKNWQTADIQAHTLALVHVHRAIVCGSIAIKRMNIWTFWRKLVPTEAIRKHYTHWQWSTPLTEEIKIFLHFKIVWNDEILVKRKTKRIQSNPIHKRKASL